METIFLTTRDIAQQLEYCITNYDEFYWAVAWDSTGPLADLLITNKHKIRNILIGIHFAQTEPQLLDSLSCFEGSRFAINSGNGTFHPKLYYFQSRDGASAIIGSANFTKAGTTNNIESAIFPKEN